MSGCPYCDCPTATQLKAKVERLEHDLDTLRGAVDDYLYAQNSRGYSQGRKERTRLCEVVYDLNVRADATGTQNAPESSDAA